MSEEEYLANPWIFDDKPFTDDMIKDYVGFVYNIVNVKTNEQYIGRKYFHNIRKVKGKRNRQRADSNWKEYWGSSSELLAKLEEYGTGDYKRYILSLHITRGDVNFEEVKQQFLNNVLEEDNFLNGNINGKWKRKPARIVNARKYANTVNICPDK
jgi:hypothetical protein